MNTAGGETMGIITKLKSIRKTFDKYIMAGMYGEAGAPHLVSEHTLA